MCVVLFKGVFVWFAVLVGQMLQERVTERKSSQAVFVLHDGFEKKENKQVPELKKNIYDQFSVMFAHLFSSCRTILRLF